MNEVEHTDAIVEGGAHVLAQSVVSGRCFRKSTFRSADGVVEDVERCCLQQGLPIGVAPVEGSNSYTRPAGNGIEWGLASHFEDHVNCGVEKSLLIALCVSPHLTLLEHSSF
jgi:hypothetical protein